MILNTKNLLTTTLKLLGLIILSLSSEETSLASHLRYTPDDHQGRQDNKFATQSLWLRTNYRHSKIDFFSYSDNPCHMGNYRHQTAEGTTCSLLEAAPNQCGSERVRSHPISCRRTDNNPQSWVCEIDTIHRPRKTVLLNESNCVTPYHS